jgi:DNA/RNA endonuclease G (NUC1)
MDMSNKKIWKRALIIALIVLIVVIVALLMRKDKTAQTAETAVAPAMVSAPASLQRPAVGEDWLELPGEVGDSDYEVETYFDASVRNYTHLYDKETYTSLWTAYPLNASYMGDEPRPGKWIYSTSIDE